MEELTMLEATEYKGFLRATKDGFVRCDTTCQWKGRVNNCKDPEDPAFSGSDMFRSGSVVAVAKDELVPRHFSWFKDNPPPEPKADPEIEAAIVNARSWEVLQELAKEHLDLEVVEEDGRFDECREFVLSHYRKLAS
jgi:hypothetical protein